ncbi:MAG: hypothetical protein ACP6IY_18385 [Promethearchaeia archaeon]
MAKKKSKKKVSIGKGLYCEKECHDLMARVCGKSKTSLNLRTFLDTFRDIFVLTAALGVLSNEPILPLPSDPNSIIRTVNENDIKIEHDNILKAIAYWHLGAKKNDKNCHRILVNINEVRKIGEKYCFAGKNDLKQMINTGMFDSEISKKLLEKLNESL